MVRNMNMSNNFSGVNKTSSQNAFNSSLKKPATNSGTGTGAFMAKLGTGVGLGVGGYGIKKITDLNDLTDNSNNISDFGHINKVFGIGENDASVGTSVGSSSEAMPFTGKKTFPILKDKSPLDKMDFKEKLKNLEIRKGAK